MSLDKLNASLARDVADVEREGRAKAPERIITGYVPAAGARGPRYRLQGSVGEYLRMNANSYLSLSHHPKVLHAADEAARALGAGPGAVRVVAGPAGGPVARA